MRWGEGWCIVLGLRGGDGGMVKPALRVFLYDTFSLFNASNISPSKLSVGNEGPPAKCLYCLT